MVYSISPLYRTLHTPFGLTWDRYPADGVSVGLISVRLSKSMSTQKSMLHFFYIVEILMIVQKWKMIFFKKFIQLNSKTFITRFQNNINSYKRWLKPNRDYLPSSYILMHNLHGPFTIDIHDINPSSADAQTMWHIIQNEHKIVFIQNHMSHPRAQVQCHARNAPAAIADRTSSEMTPI